MSPDPSGLTTIADSDALGAIAAARADAAAPPFPPARTPSSMNLVGRVRIRHLFIDETHLHPFDGVGRRVGVELDLVYVGDR